MTQLDLRGNDPARFNNLSIQDLLLARSAFHVFLTQKPNVVATAIGRYLTRDKPPVKGKPKPPRTLFNSSHHANA